LHVTVRYAFVDCRWSLDDPGFGRRAYLAGHIPGAAFVDVERDLSAESGPGGRHPLPSAAQFTSAASSAGIEDTVQVVAYGSSGGAERLWWLLRHFGHDACAIIELDAWRGPLRSGEEAVAPGVFVPRQRTDDTALLDEIADRGDELVLVDTRVSSRWRGEQNPLDRVPGRIPGALSAPWNEPLPDLPEGELVAYCGSGVTACVVLHRLQLGGRAGRLYPGSWSEWEQHSELPREVGVTTSGR
jgi:thiosulfate/3-mercaptopyruvate sulfurtransferase